MSSDMNAHDRIGAGRSVGVYDPLHKAASFQPMCWLPLLCLAYLERHLLHGPHGRMTVSKTRSVTSMASPTFREHKGKVSILQHWRKACTATIYVETQVPKVGSVRPSWYQGRQRG